MASHEEDEGRTRILEAIDQLRQRKARPDVERISHMIQRKHGRTYEQTQGDLDRLVATGVVIKVEYKGSTSYRNAAKWRKNSLEGTSEINKLVLTAKDFS